MSDGFIRRKKAEDGPSGHLLGNIGKKGHYFSAMILGWN
jgi:hypothetical protein